MWAYELVGPGLLEAVDTSAPTPDALEQESVLLRVLAGGICGSDIPKLSGQVGVLGDGHGRVRRGRPGFPMHEVVGEVIASRHDELGVSARVVGWAIRSDALAEFVVTDGNQVCRYDESLTPPDAVLIQPLACVLHAIERIPVADATIAVVGLGPIGLLFAHVAKSRGAQRVIGVDPVNRDAVATSFGIDDLVTAPCRTWSRSLTEARRPDVVVEAVGHQVTTLDDAIAAVAPGGTVLYFGIPDDEYYPLNMKRMTRKNLTLVAGVTRDRRGALTQAGDYLMHHPNLCDVIITHRFERTTVQQAYDAATTAAPDRLKVVLSLAGS
jgi:L-iditol 2-dehydrogenase